nr:hypothetical protein [Francisella philomiragia]ACJ31795.1 hypothetical protein [Francisella philomiragia subsp. philomiragia ATCC 25017]
MPGDLLLNNVYNSGAWSKEEIKTLQEQGRSVLLEIVYTPVRGTSFVLSKMYDEQKEVFYETRYKPQAQKAAKFLFNSYTESNPLYKTTKTVIEFIRKENQQEFDKLLVNNSIRSLSTGYIVNQITRAILSRIVTNVIARGFIASLSSIGMNMTFS